MPPFKKKSCTSYDYVGNMHCGTPPLINFDKWTSFDFIKINDLSKNSIFDKSLIINIKYKSLIIMINDKSSFPLVAI